MSLSQLLQERCTIGYDQCGFCLLKCQLTAIVVNCSSASFRDLQIARALASFVESGDESEANTAILSMGRIVLNW